MAVKTIPKDYKDALKDFVRLEEKAANKFVEVLTTSTPAILLTSLAPKLAQASGIEKSQARTFLVMLASMSRARGAEESIDRFLASVRSAAVEEDLLSQDEIETQWPRAAKHLANALKSKAIEISAKALSVMVANERMLCNVRVLSDMRPIFSDDLEPTACVILHQLKVAFHEQEEYEKVAETFITLDHGDLLRLRSTIDRALKKHDKLEELAKKTGLQVLAAKE